MHMQSEYECFSLKLAVFAYTSQKMKFFIQDILSKCDQIRKKLKKSLMENYISYAVLKHF